MLGVSGCQWIFFLNMHEGGSQGASDVYMKSIVLVDLGSMTL